MISHDRAQELISSRMDAPLSSAEHHALQSHLASCLECRAFVLQTDEIARELQAMPRLASSPIVSRAVMAAVTTDDPGWGWLRNALQALSSPGMAVASSLALVVALASVLVLALNAPGIGNRENGAAPKETIAAAVVTLPTEVPPTSTPEPTRAPAVAPTAPADNAAPTPTKPAGRTIELAAANPTKTPTPRPTATAVPIVSSAQDEPAADSPAIVPSDGGAPVDTAPAEDPALAMASDQSGDGGATADLAQAAAPEVDEAQPAESTDTGAAVDAAPSDSGGAVATEPAASGRKNEGGKKGNGEKSAPEAAAAEPEPTRPIGPVPIEAIAALEGAGGVPNISLPPTPPGPYNPSRPNQSFLPVTPTPADGTPTPATESEVPQLADQSSSDLGLAALVPDNPAVVNAPDAANVDTKKAKDKGKRDKETNAGNSHEEQQAAWTEAPMGWSSQPVEIAPLAAWQESTDQPAEQLQETDYPADESAGVTGDQGGASTDGAADAADGAAEPQIDPATGMAIDPATGFLIDPTTGYLIDRVHGRIIDPRTSYEVHPMTGLLIDPATGALLDPNTLEVVIPAGFGSDQPKYSPGSGDMRGQIENVVDSTYDNATIKIEPPTDGPVQPAGDIVVPTESGDALEIS